MNVETLMSDCSSFRFQMLWYRSDVVVSNYYPGAVYIRDMSVVLQQHMMLTGKKKKIDNGYIAKII